MSSFFGQYLKLSLFGQSHGPAIGIVIDGLPAGLRLDRDAIAREMARRAPGQNALSTPRQEKDEVKLLSGVVNDVLTGQPLCAMIENTSHRSSDYGEAPDLLRPGHADYTGHVRYYGFQDFRGSGHFSGRLTAPVLFAGAVCKQVLLQKGIVITARAVEIGGETEPKAMEQAILRAKEDQDSVGGAVRCTASGVPAGLGAPFFDSVESVLSHLLFSVPGVKALSFGDGLEVSRMRGSVYNDPFILKDGRIATKTNHTGGVQGGITNGADIVFTCFLRPPASIEKTQQTVSLRTMQEAELSVHGRHDPCIVLRATPVIEAMAAIGLTELWKERLACPV